jgi:hypothetical protein
MLSGHHGRNSATCRENIPKCPISPDTLARPEALPTTEARLRRLLNAYAVELSKLADMLPNRVSEYRLLQLSEAMSATADEAERSAEAVGAGLRYRG